MKSIGMIKIPKNVAVVIPATTVIPIDVRAPEPAPVEIANGNTPRMNAKDVIKIGRKRILAASIAASTTSIPRSSTRIFAYSIIRIAFLAAKPTKVNKPICM